MNISKILATGIAAATIFLLSPDAEARTKTISISPDLTKVINYTSADVQYSTGKPGVELIGSDQDLARLRVIETEGVLVFQSASGRNAEGSDLDVVIKITGQNVNSFITYGSGDLRVEHLVSPNAMLIAYGSGDISVNTVKGSALQLCIYGSGDLKVNSSDADALKIYLQGSGDISVRSIKATSVTAALNGSGDISIPAVSAASLQVTNSGSGDISVGGDVSSLTLVNQGSGDINAKSLKAKNVTKIHQGTGDIYD